MEAEFCLFILALAATTCLAVEEQVLLNFYNSLGMQPLYPATSCREIYKFNYASHEKSGYYWIKPSVDAAAVKVYCDMELSCGGRDGGWIRIAKIEDGDSCPTGWKQILSPVKACRGTSGAVGCNSAYFNNQYNLTFQHVCGKAIGYQKGTPDAFNAFNYSTYPSIDGPYIDGLSITYGTPRKHLFTYACGYSSGTINTYSNCPCATLPGDSPPSFVRNNHYCESGSADRPLMSTVYDINPLWDGKGCNAGNSCCAQPGMPWFYRDVLTKISEPIEARICRDQNYSNEGILIKDLELYIQ